jgi:Fe-S oxidoreductase
MVLLSRWLASCSGCGMCEEVCQRSVPLTLLVSALSHRIREENDYITGSPDQPPPWAGD